MSQTAFNIRWNSKETGCNASEELSLLANEGKRQRTKASFSRVFYTGCHQVWPRSKVDLPISEDLDLGRVFPPQVIQVYTTAWVLVSSSQVDNQ